MKERQAAPPKEGRVGESSATSKRAGKAAKAAPRTRRTGKTSTTQRRRRERSTTQKEDARGESSTTQKRERKAPPPQRRRGRESTTTLLWVVVSSPTPKGNQFRLLQHNNSIHAAVLLSLPWVVLQFSAWAVRPSPSSFRLVLLSPSLFWVVVHSTLQKET